MTKTLSGAALLLFALAMMLYNVSDTLSDLRDWHALTTPAIVAAILKQVAAVTMAAVGGTLLPTGGPKA